MGKDPAFLFYPGDYLKDTQCLSEKAQVAYDRIMCAHMNNICISQVRLNFFIKKLNEEEKEQLMEVLKKVDNGYQIEWVVLSIENRKAYNESRRRNRKGKGKKKSNDMNNTCKTYDEHMENENEIEDVIVIGDEEPKKKKDQKHKHGEYKHVLLTEDQYRKLIDDFGVAEVNDMIKELDEAIEQYGYKYKNHNLTLRKWRKKNKGSDKPQKKEKPTATQNEGSEIVKEIVESFVPDFSHPSQKPAKLEKPTKPRFQKPQEEIDCLVEDMSKFLGKDANGEEAALKYMAGEYDSNRIYIALSNAKEHVGNLIKKGIKINGRMAILRYQLNK
jgi:hypothetical protein